MPRQARLGAPTTLHHVMTRGIERRNIFLGEEDYEDFLRRFEKAIVAASSASVPWGANSIRWRNALLHECPLIPFFLNVLSSAVRLSLLIAKNIYILGSIGLMMPVSSGLIAFTAFNSFMLLQIQLTFPKKYKYL